MNHIKKALLFLLVALPVSGAFASNGISLAHSERINLLSSVALSGSQKVLDEGANAAAFDAISFDALGRRFDLALRPNRSLLNAAAKAEVTAYRGELLGTAGSWVRVVVVDGLPQGVIWDGREMHAVEIARDEQTGERYSFIYRLADLEIEPGTLTCSHISSADNAAELFSAVAKESAVAASAPGATQQIDVGVIADFEFTDANGSNTDAEIVTRMNIVDGIFSEQLGVQINVTGIESFATSSDPFTDEADAGALIDELSDYRNATPAQNANGLTHLFTGRELDGSTIGVAFAGALCSRRFGAGLTQGTLGTTLDALVAAHELGHNFGAPHDGTGGACGSTAQDFLMAPSLNGSDEFSACSITQMQDDVSAASCVSPLSSRDAAVVSGGQSAAVLLGNSGSVEFEVNSVGTDTANDINVDIVIPASVSLDSVSSTQGSCSSGAGSASCSVGSVSSGSGATITVNVTTNSVGNADFTATVSATDDGNSNNNTATSTLPVDPAVDLAASVPASTSVVVDNSVTISPTIRNDATIAASNVVVTIIADSGLRIDSASWSSGSCTVAGDTATCNANSLAAQSSNDISLQVTGLTEGGQSYSVSSVAGEVDRDTSNNDTSGQVTVNPPPADDDGGSGSLGWVMLMLLLLARLRLRNTVA